MAGFRKAAAGTALATALSLAGVAAALAPPEVFKQSQFVSDLVTICDAKATDAGADDLLAT